MTELTPISAEEETLGTEFWAQSANSLRPEFNIIYVQLASALRNEARERGSSVLDYPIIERISYLYAHMRQCESIDLGEGSDRFRRERTKDWVELATNMKKLWVAEDKAGAADQILKKLDKAIFEAMKALPEGVREGAQHALAGALQAQGL